MASCGYSTPPPTEWRPGQAVVVSLVSLANKRRPCQHPRHPPPPPHPGQQEPGSRSRGTLTPPSRTDTHSLTPCRLYMCCWHPLSHNTTYYRSEIIPCGRSRTKSAHCPGLGPLYETRPGCAWACLNGVSVQLINQYILRDYYSFNK